MDAVGLAAGRDLGNLAPVGRRMGELDQIVNAGFYRRGRPRIVFPADVPAQRVLGVQVVRRILLERLHKVCDREGHDPCASILAFFKRILLADNTRLCGILPLTAVHVVVAVLPEAVDAGDGNKAVQCVKDVVAGRLHRRPLRNIGHSLRDLFCDFGLPACEGVAFMVRGFAEHGGSIAGLEASGDLILEELAFNAVGVGDGEGFDLGADALDISRDAVGAGDQMPSLVAGVPAPLDAGVLVGLLIGVGMLGISVELRDEAGSVEADGIGDRAVLVRGGAVVRVCTIRDGILIRMRLMVGRVRGALHTNLAVHVIEARLRVAGVDGVSFADRVENHIFLFTIHSPFLCFFIPEQLYSFGPIARGMLAAQQCRIDFDVKLRTDRNRAGRIITGLIDLRRREAVSKQIINRIIVSGFRCLAHDLDLEVFDNVTQIGGRDIRGRVLLAVLNLDHTRAVVQYPLAILVADHKLQRCLARIVELMRLRFFAVVLCDIRRGLDGHVVFPRLIRSRRFRPVERLALRVVDQVVVFRPAAGRADVLYLNLPDSRFHILIGGNRNKRGLRIFCFPDRVDVHGVVRRSHVNRIADPRVVAGLPVLEGVAVAGGNLLRDSERRLARVVLLVLLTRHIGDSVCRAGLVVQDVGDGGGSRNLRNQINRCALIAGRRVRGI